MENNFFVALGLIFFASSLFGFVFEKLKLPKVIGEIFGGIVLGPNILGVLIPNLTTSVISPELNNLNLIASLGLILLMFCSGFEIESSTLKRGNKLVLLLLITTTLIPFTAGWMITDYFTSFNIMGESKNSFSLHIIVSIVIAVISIPVISRIFMDLNIMQTDFARKVLSIATIHDIVLWFILSIAVNKVSNVEVSLINFIFNLLYTGIFFVVSFIALPSIFKRINSQTIYNKIKGYEFLLVFVILLLYMFISNELHISTFLSALLAGAIIGISKNENFISIRKSIKDFSFALFVPVYFAMAGMKMNFNYSFDFPLFIQFFAFAFLVVGLTVLITTKANGCSWNESLNYVFALNAKGGPCIVIATISLESKIISTNFYNVLIVLAITTSLIAGVWLRRSVKLNRI